MTQIQDEIFQEVQEALIKQYKKNGTDREAFLSECHDIVVLYLESLGKEVAQDLYQQIDLMFKMNLTVQEFCDKLAQKTAEWSAA